MYHIERTDGRDNRAGSDGRAHGEAPAQSPEGTGGAQGPVPGRFAGRHGASRVRGQTGLLAQDARPDRGIEKNLWPYAHRGRQPSPARDQMRRAIALALFAATISIPLSSARSENRMP